MARIMAIDFGGKRTGIAVTDELKLTAQPLTTVSTAGLLEFIEGYLKQAEVEKIVFGIPYSADGQLLPIARRLERFMDTLCKKYPELELVGQDESFSSFEASQAMIQGGMPKKKRQQKGALDMVSATIILQRYMEYNL